MNTIATSRIRALASAAATAAVAAASALLPTLAAAQTPQQQYTQDAAACRAGDTTQSLSDCLYDARSMLRDRLARKPIPAPSREELLANASRRCQSQPLPDDREACIRMVRGDGQREGSVAEGAVLMELTTRTVGPVPAAQ